MTVELNGVFVPGHLQSKLEHHLRSAWARSTFSPDAFRVRWVHRDPGELVIGVELGKARVLRRPNQAPASDRQLLARDLTTELREVLTGFLRANQH